MHIVKNATQREYKFHSIIYDSVCNKEALASLHNGIDISAGDHNCNARKINSNRIDATWASLMCTKLLLID